MTSMNLAKARINVIKKSTSKTLMSSYTDAGSDIITAGDAFTTLHYGNGLKHS